MIEQLTSLVELMALMDLEGHKPLSEPQRQTFHKLRRLRAHAEAGDNQALIQELQNENQPDEIIRVYAASVLVSDQVNPTQLEALGRFLQADKNISVRLALAKRLKDVPLDQVVIFLLKAIIYDQNTELRAVAAESARDVAAASWEAWQEKVATLLKLIEESDYYREHLDIAALVAAVLPPHPLIQIPDDRLRLADYLIRVAPKYSHDPRLTGILAALIIQSCDHNLQRVVHRVNQFIAGRQDAADNLAPLQAEVNSLLTPAELQTNLKESYQTPMKTMQEDVRSKWKMSVFSAQASLVLRIAVSLFAASIGLWLLGKGASNLSNEATWPVSFLQIGLGLVLLLIFLINRGPVRDIQQTLVNIGVANMVYATFTQQSLDISHRYTTLSLQNRLAVTEMQASNKLLAEAMKNAVHTLRGEKPPTLDELLEQYS